jgi:hypothetical protein
MLPSPVRRWAPLALVGLLAALLPMAASIPTAQASASCKSEQPGLLGITCDDEKPPNTTGASGNQTAAGQVTVSATGTYSDGDTDPIGFQCQLVGTAAWGPCTVSNLTVGANQIAIRALDTADFALNTPCDDLLCGSTPEVPDYDATPAVITVQVTGGGGGGGTTPPPPGPGGAPETQITGGPNDRLTPGQPVSLTRRPTIELTASEPATYNCAVNAKKVPCRGGLNVLKGLKPGTQVFVAQAVDRDGNFDATPASITFYIPYNLTPHQGNGWKKVKSHGSFAGDFVSTTHTGAVLTVGEVTGVHEVRLIAPVGPNLGKVAIRIGNGKWMKVHLTSKKARRLVVFELRGTRAGAHELSGTIQVKALKVPAGGAVAVDAIVAR